MATIRNNLGGAYQSLGQYQKAIEYFQQSLAIENKFFEQSHPKVTTTKANLAYAQTALNKQKTEK